MKVQLVIALIFDVETEQMNQIHLQGNWRNKNFCGIFY